MWGRRPGQSVGDRIAELDAERAQWVRGQHGEIRVGDELDHLPEGEWWVFHAIPRGPSGTDIDHLVIGVGGVFTVNTKNVTGNVWVAERTLMVAGAKTNYLPAATHEARDAAARLSRSMNQSINVFPLLVFTRSITVKAHPTDVRVLEASTVRPWLIALPRVLTPDEAYKVALAADQPSIWR